jgi:hypothetical protein
VKKIRPTDVPEDLIQALAQAGRRDADEAADFAVWMLSAMQAVVVDFNLERALDRLRHDIALGHFDC